MLRRLFERVKSFSSIKKSRDLGNLRRRFYAEIPAQGELIQKLIEGYRRFAETGITEDQAYFAMRELYWRSHGRSNQIISEHLRKRFPPEPAPTTIKSLFGEFSSFQIAAISSQIKEVAFYRFPNLLESSLIDSIDCSLQQGLSDGEADVDVELGRTTYHENLLFRVSEIVSLAADPLLRYIAADYLGTDPVLGYMTSWKSKAHDGSVGAKSRMAQLFHVDMSNPNFLKVFVYLSDVGARNGPHCVVKRSHRIRDEELWKDGRISDEAMARHHPRSDWETFCGPRGSVFVVDTSAFHKGVEVLEGERHILQLYYVDTLFGEHYPAKGCSLPKLQVSNRFFSRLDGQPS